MNFYELMNKRHSVRTFDETPLTDDEISRLLEAATAAPNACNYQSWHFYIVRGREMINGFVPTVYRGEWFRSAATVFVVCTDADKLMERFGERGGELFAIQDTACAVDHLMLMAAEIGLGSCFVGAFDEAECRKYLNIPKTRRPVALIPVGHAAAEIPKRARKPVSEVCTFIGDGVISDNKQKEKIPFTLRTASIPGAVFDDLNLVKSSFNNINMNGVSFTDINMSNATFGGMTMKGSSFGCVDMQETKFNNPDFTDALFNNCKFKNVKIENCDIEGMTIDGREILDLLKNRV